MAIGSFNNPITGEGGDLVRTEIQSPNFVHGVSGWSLNKDGSAEFSDLTARGTVTGSKIVIDDATGSVLIYSAVTPITFGAPVNPDSDMTSTAWGTLRTTFDGYNVLDLGAGGSYQSGNTWSPTGSYATGLSSNTGYKLTCTAYLPSDFTAGAIQIEWIDSSGNSVGQADQVNFPTGQPAGWYTIEAGATSPPTCTAAYLNFWIYTSASHPYVRQLDMDQGSGALLASIAAVAGTDSYGYQYPAGVFFTEGFTYGSLLSYRTVGSNQLGIGSVINEKIASGAVGTSNIASAAITNALMAAAAVATANIQDGAITTTQINAAAGILGGQLAANAGIVGGQIASGTLTNSNLASSVTARSLGGITTTISATAPASPVAGDIWIDSANGYQLQQYSGTAWTPVSWTATDVITSGSITTTLLNSSVTARALGGITTTIAGTAPASPVAGDIWINSASGYQINQYSGTAWVAVSWTATDVISAGTISGALIEAATITGSLIAAGTITASNIAANTITATQIAAATITGSLIAASTITGGNIAAGTITASNIAAGTITGSLIAANTITGSLIAANTITAGELVSGIVVAGIVDSTTIKTATLIGSTILGYATSTARGPYDQSFETGTGSWTGTNAALSQDSSWSSAGTYSLKLTASASGAMSAESPTQTCVANDPLSVSVDLYAASALSDVYVGIRWMNGGTEVSETDTTAQALGTGAQVTLTVSDVAPSTANGYQVVVGDSNASGAASRTLNADNVMASGNLAFSAAVAPGTDSYSNAWDQGIEIKGLNGLTSAFTVQDAWGQATLAAIDGYGNITGQTVSATSDVIVAGQSLTNDILPPYPLGLISYGYVQNGNLPTTLDASGTTRVLYELDQQVFAGRTYKISLGNCGITMSAGGNRMFFEVRATQDGSTPSLTNGDIILKAGVYCPVANWFFAGAHRSWRPASDLTLRCIVTVQPFGASGQITQAFGSTFSQDNSDTLSLTVEDIGQNLGENATWVNSTSGSGTTGTQTYTKTYTCTASYCYQGSDAGSGFFDKNGSAYQGGDVADTGNGKMKSWLVFPHSTIASDLSGATINSVSLYLNNNHSWYYSGMTCCVGYDTKTSFGSTAADPSGSTIDVKEESFSEGQAKWFSLPNSIGTAFQNGTAYNIVLFKNSNNLTYYGFFAGASQSGPPQLKINYTK